MKAIIQKVLQSTPKEIPQLPQKISKQDVDLLISALKDNMSKKVESNLLRLLLAQCYDKMNDGEFIRTLLNVQMLQIEETGFADEAKLRVCEGIIKADNTIRAHTVENYLKDFQNKNVNDPEIKARLQKIAGGLCFLKGDYIKATNKLINASKFQIYLNNPKQKTRILEQAIAYAFISQKNSEQHQNICALYIHELSKKSPLYSLLTKLYSQQMINIKEVDPIRQFLPSRIFEKDIDNVSIIAKAIFAHNMLSILKVFSNVTLKTVSELIGIGEEEVLLMIEKTYRNEEVEVDLMDGCIEVRDNEEHEQQLLKDWFGKIERVLNLMESETVATETKK